MKPPMNEACEPVRNAGTNAKKMDPNATIKNAGTQRKGGLNVQKNIKNSSTPDPKMTRNKGGGY
jgi:hypothetical protein